MTRNRSRDGRLRLSASLASSSSVNHLSCEDQMPPLRLTTALTAAALAAGVAGLSTVAHAAPVASQKTVVFLDRLPCQSDPGAFRITLAIDDRLHERSDGERYHENSRSSATLSATPVAVDERTGAVAPRAGSAWSGRLTVLHTANNGSTGAGHAVSTFRLHISATNEDGGRLRQQGLAHYTGTAVPDADAAVVRRFFATTDCR